MPDVLGRIGTPSWRERELLSSLGALGIDAPVSSTPQGWREKLSEALTLKPYLDPMQPVDLAKGLYGIGKRGLGFFGSALRGEVDPTPEGGEAVPRMFDLASLAPAGGLLNPEEAAVGAGIRTKLPEVGRWEKFAEKYPPVAKPETRIDPRTGNEFLGKTLTPETEAFRKDRALIQKDIEAGNYNPYFDVGKRYDVDPKLFPPFEDTSNILKARPETQAKYDAIANAPEARTELDAAFDKGFEHASTTGSWYMMGQLADEFVKQYGPQEGPAMFKQKFADAMAATTGGADPTANLLMAHLGNYLTEADKPIPTAAYKFPFPVGGRYVTGNMEQYNKMIRQGEGVTPANPKRYNFSGAFQGNPSAATIDEQMMSPYNRASVAVGGPKMLMPPTGTYGHFQKALGSFGVEKGVDPRFYQEVGWAGLKDSTGMPMIQHVNEAVERTHRLSGASPEEVVKEALVKSKRPLYANPRRAMAPLLALMRGKKPVLETDLSTPAATETPIAPPFYSAVEQAVSAAKQNKAPGPQWMGMLKNAPGIKPEELETLGLQKYLSQGTVPPQGELMGRLAKGESNPLVPNTFTKKEVLDQVRQNKVAVEDKLLGPQPGQPATPKRPKKDTSPATDQEISDVLARAKHGWTGLQEDLADAFKEGERRATNREMTRAPQLIDRILNRHATDAERSEAAAEAAVALRNRPQADVVETTPTQYGKYTMPGGKNYRELLLKLPQKEIGVDKSKTNLRANLGADFQSSHFHGEPNILAHVRFNDRTDAAGKKTLFIEEIQSDWHQAGRKRGYHDPKLGEIGGQPPDAPFKTSWPELALKRMVKWASDHGYDQVAWTPGKAQAERYNLSQHVDYIRAQNSGDGTFMLAGGKRGQELFARTDINKSELADYVGKELAEKIIKGEGGEAISSDGKLRRYTGLDLNVGGHGMKGFYDRILPAAANKLFDNKKYGAKVGTTNLKTGMKPPSHVDDVRDLSPAEFERLKSGEQEVWSLPITDEMRAEAKGKGFPLFTGGAPLGMFGATDQQGQK